MVLQPGVSGERDTAGEGEPIPGGILDYRSQQWVIDRALADRGGVGWPLAA
jgi:hypothetical protein